MARTRPVVGQPSYPLAIGRLRLVALLVLAVVAVPAPPSAGLVVYTSALNAIVDTGGRILALGRGAAIASPGRVAQACGSALCIDDVRILLPGRPSLVTWSPDETRLPFVMATAGHDAIWVVDTDGEGLRNLCGTWRPLLRYLDLTWEPSGMGVTFAATTPGASGHRPDVYRIDLDAGGFRALTADPGVDRSPAWSPDGTRLAFATRREGRWTVAIVSGSGQVRFLPSGPGDLLDPAWIRIQPGSG